MVCAATAETKETGTARGIATMKFIGLLMTSGENDILGRTLGHNAQWCDALYTLDGGDGYDLAVAIVAEINPFDDYWQDDELPYRKPVRDGARQWLYEQAVHEHGVDNWFLLLHGDEVWKDDPRGLPKRYPDADGFVFRLPLCYRPHEWRPDRPVLEQMTGRLRPGYPEFRMFRGGTNVSYDPAQHFNTQPRGLTNIVQTDREILHYAFRSPESQMLKKRVSFAPDNFTDCPMTGDQIEAKFFGRSEHYMHLSFEHTVGMAQG